MDKHMCSTPYMVLYETLSSSTGVFCYSKDLLPKLSLAWDSVRNRNCLCVPGGNKFLAWRKHGALADVYSSG